MKPLIRWMLALAVVAAAAHWQGMASAQIFQAGGEQHSVLTIEPDGTCLFVTESVEPRAAAEQQMRMMERFQKTSEAAEEGEDSTTTAADLSATNAAAEPKPFTDEELAKKITDTMNERAEEGAEGPGQNINVQVKKDLVVTTTTRAFSSIEDLLKEGYAIWNLGGLAFQNARFETDTNGLLRVTLTPRSGMERYLKTFRSEWKLSSAKSELRLVFPGKVIASGFPAMQTNATWLTVDAKQDESLDALAKLYTAPTVITAESAGLKLPQPLESKNLGRSNRRRGEAGDDLPITNAMPGFVAEAQSITTTILHVFPGGEDYFKQRENSREARPGAIVNIKLFAPKGRTLQSVNDVRVLTALDNKGRSVVAETGEGEEVSSGGFSGGSSDANSLQVQLPLQLPQPDAQSIDEITVEAVAVTAGAWKEMTLTNLQENATNEFDLAAVLPDAKLAITKFTSKNAQFNLQARLKGPSTVKRLDVRAKIPGNDQFNSYSSERQFNVKNKEATRLLSLQGYGFGDEASSSQDSLVLVIRYPEDLRRERVKFNLKALDLL